MRDFDGDWVLEILELEPALASYLRRFAKQRADVEDLLQGVYERLLKMTPLERARVTCWKAFAITTARNLALDWLRHSRVVPIQLVAENGRLDVLDERVRVVELVAAQQELKAAEAAVAALPPRCREVFVLRRVHGCSQREIAQRLGISENTVEQHLVKAVRRLMAIKNARAEGLVMGSVRAQLQEA